MGGKGRERLGGEGGEKGITMQGRELCKAAGILEVLSCVCLTRREYMQIF